MYQSNKVQVYTLNTITQQKRYQVRFTNHNLQQR